jgi:hypothetical protein
MLTDVSEELILSISLQKTDIFILISMRTSDLAKYKLILHLNFAGVCGMSRKSHKMSARLWVIIHWLILSEKYFSTWVEISTIT